MRALIIDDEIFAIETLRTLLNSYVPSITEIHSADNVEDGIAMIKSLTPDLLFTDINMPRLNGIELIEGLETHKMDIIVVSAYNSYALTVINLSVSGYLVKPVNVAELLKVLKKIIDRRNAQQKPQSKESLHDGKIAIQLKEGVEFVSIKEIVMVEAMGSYAKIHLSNKRVIVLSKPLKIIEDVLPKDIFFRVHRSSMVNIKHIVRYKPLKDGGTIYLINGLEVELSRVLKMEFQSIMDNYNLGIV